VIGYGENAQDSHEKVNNVEIVRLRNVKSNYGVLLNYFAMVTNRMTFYFKIRKYIDLINPDIVETYDWNAPLIFKPRKGILITRIHGSNTAFNSSIHLRRTPVLHFLERRAILQSDYIISVSNYIAELTQRTFKINFTYKTIYNGVDTDIFYDQRIERNHDEITLVGRMHPYKGFDDLFKAMNYIFDSNSRIRFKIICTVIDKYQKILMSYIDPKYESRIVFIGRVKHEDLPYHYNLANLTVLPSRTEAFPIIPLESMACGTPVIMADRFSAREIIDDGVDGYLTDTSNPKEFARKICEILKQQYKIEDMRKKCRNKIVRMFNGDKISNDNIKFYNSILEGELKEN
jgi:glycosyltransferase involved in cell wall biosynthesis